ncbi:hypothetical protein [Streptomyces sp. NPDC088812]|uniref:hypothetical protein n=1 Tax=Streptomyces sp. NPDC088812 TaxID=3365905 RepID=UPI003821E936
MTAPVAVIMGAASAGIGEAAVRPYAERGHRVLPPPSGAENSRRTRARRPGTATA